MKTLLINRNFKYMWGSQFLSILNGRFRELVIPLVVLALTSSPLVTALVALSQQAGTILFAIPIGTWIENKHKVKIAASCHFLYGIGIFILAFLLATNNANAVIIASLLFVMGLIALISRTAFTSMIPGIAGRENLLKAHTSIEAADAIATVIGPALGGIVLAETGSVWTLFICAALSLLSTLLIVFIRREEGALKVEKETSAKHKWKAFLGKALDGMKILLDNPQQLISTLVMCMLGFTTVFITLTIIFYAQITMQLSEGLIGILLSSAGVGNIAGIFLINKLKNKNWITLLTVLMIISGIGILMIIATNAFFIMCLGMAVFDCALSMAFIVQGAVHQGITPDEFLTRVRSSTYVIGGIFSMLGTFLAGALPELFTGKTALIIGAFILLIPAFIMLRFGKFGVELSKVVPIYRNKKV
ncbi:MFS transporter [Oceanobacillus neutriphilus]|uniref:MFS transporter n=1 Tax=Oceanobacillus neutriphilus TaxID=531815 RepID=A0ABQ2P2K9_9BACI|nr:MFS transporter [Oceanobacillus neutriphilus]GGP16346.1 MFS transporter [Oceanobacillus neutriphilus]